MSEADPGTTGPQALATEAELIAARSLFGLRLEVAVAFVDALSTSAVERGLVGPREVGRIWSRHVLNCAVVCEVIPEQARVVDVGSGAGLPGIALALARPDLDVVLLEPLLRRTLWLGETVASLGLRNVRVERGRAEDVRGRLGGDVVTARAVAALPKLAGWCLPLVRPGGSMLALKGENARAELADAVPVLRRSGASRWDVVECGADLLAEPTTVVRVFPGLRAAPSR